MVEPHRAEMVDLGPATLRVWEWGEPGHPAVLCLHGAFDHGRMFDGLAPRLVERGFHILAPDLRGHGDSVRVSSGHVWEASALDIARLARRLGTVGIVGHSFGGGQALFVASVWPELVRWVVDLDGLGPPSAELSAEVDLTAECQRSFDALDRLRSQPPRVYPTHDDAAERRRRINVRLPEEWLAHLVRHGTEVVEGGVSWKADPLFNVGFPDSFSVDVLVTQFRAVECPVLVLTGTEPDTWSNLDPVDIATRVEALRAVHHSVADAGHYLHLEQPDLVDQRLAAFLAEVGP